MIHFFSDKSILTLAAMTLVAIAAATTCVCTLSQQHTAYLLGRATIPYVIPISPTPQCLVQTQLGRFIYTKPC